MRKKPLKILVGCLMLLVLILGALIFSITPEFVKNKIVEKASKSFNAKLEIDNLEFKLLKGEARLEGVRLEKIQGNSSLNVREIESVEVKLRIMPLFIKKVQIIEVIINKPNVDFTFNQKEKEEKPSLEKLENLLMKVLAKVANDLKEAVLEFLGLLASNPGYEINISNLEVHQGEVNFHVLKKEDSFHAQLTEVEYKSLDLNPDSATAFLKRADITALIQIGDQTSRYEQRFSSEPRKVELTDFNLGYADNVGSQKDALIINNGFATFRFKDKSVELLINELKLEKNENAQYPDFMFVAVDKLIKHVEDSDGKLEFRFQLNPKDFKASDDVDFVLQQILKGFLQQAKKRYAEPVVESLKSFIESLPEKDKKMFQERGEELKEIGKEKIKGFLEKLKSKEE